MRDIYTRECEAVAAMVPQEKQFNYLTSCLRSIYQTAAVTCLELIKGHGKLCDHFQEFESLAVRFHQPSDGLPLEILDRAVPLIRSLITADFLVGWYETSQNHAVMYVREMEEWVQFRNRVAHGVADQHDISEWSPKMLQLFNRGIAVLTNLLPIVDDSNGKIYFSEALGGASIQTPLVDSGKPLVITKVQEKRGVWKVHAKQLCWDESLARIIEIDEPNIFCDGTSHTYERFEHSTVLTSTKKFGMLHNIPSRQTSIFEGRKKELDKLASWINEPTESKSCLVYGDGGYGKTTLVLEFLNNLLDGYVPIESPPDIISYHTAKMTKWTDQGIIHCRGISGAMGESIRELLYCFQDVVGKEWYKVDGVALINKIQTELNQNGYNRDNILLVLDNTETLISSTADQEELTNFFEEVSRKIGRIIITSRRREDIGAKPIKVTQLEEGESLKLIKRLASEYSAGPLQQAGEPKLRKACTKLMHKPLLIDALVKYIGRTGTGIDEALGNVLRKTNDQLLDFLYEDAWQRLNEGQRDVFLVMVSITCPSDEFSVGHACQQVGIPHDEFLAALDETYFANQSKQLGTYKIEMVDLAKNFFERQLGKVSAEHRQTIQSHVEAVDEYAREKEVIDREYKSDRVAEAFRVQYAKAAKNYAEKGMLTEAKDAYELALLEDPLNSALHDRFAWFLLHKTHNVPAAFEISKKAVELDEQNPDALLTLGIIHYRMHDLKTGDEFINKAANLGKPITLCLLRKGIGRYHTARVESEFSVATKLITEALDFLRKAQRKLIPGEAYYRKNKLDIERHLALIYELQHQLRETLQK
ncbi:hypothetical protein I5I50_23930 [Pseudomonas aeruginosa]|uniref:ATP-binding protein n=1 Tax=Pseudomonas aeruginosa TaxID=287 RepID=UPI00128F38C3|nr:ATP-binding protein [Pseudomonas aeruginosa]MBG4252966.1 hypothetical protein [Pseudomonas aeruginosa]MBG4277128.1 hypothetical protein [Pseudomonas aeruginosa]MBG5787387.1 hypothetical protein [Pseudomonas aeruginosa]MBG6557821.1 hypothetical protein [Pseudomonas aeruginosa]MBG7073604.1 hypothetical protein [Pseudomonas aeruginosa]